MMNAAAERQGSDILPRDVEPLRVVITGGVAIARAEETDHAVAALQQHLLVADLDVFGRFARRQLHGRIVTQQFLHRIGRKRGIACQQFPLIGLAMQREQAVADEIGRRLVTRGEKQVDVGGELVLRQAAVVLVAHGEQRADEIVAGLLGAPLEQTQEISARPNRAGIGFLEFR